MEKEKERVGLAWSVRRCRIWQMRKRLPSLVWGPIEVVPGLSSFRELGPQLLGSSAADGARIRSSRLASHSGDRCFNCGAPRTVEGMHQLKLCF
jgi:hypothetical protein